MPSPQLCVHCTRLADLDALTAYHIPNSNSFSDSGFSPTAEFRFPAASPPSFVRWRAADFSPDTCPACRLILAVNDRGWDKVSIEAPADENVDAYSKSAIARQMITESSVGGLVKKVKGFKLGIGGKKKEAKEARKSYFGVGVVVFQTWYKVRTPPLSKGDDHSNDGMEEEQEGYRPMETFRLRLFAPPGADKEVLNYVTGRAVTEAGSDVALGRVKEWTDKCINSHTRCKTGVSGTKYNDKGTPPSLPTRVIDVMGNEGDGEGAPAEVATRLVWNKDGEMRGKYVALSYCWGPPSENDKQTTLLKATEEGFYREIPVSEMPKTIRDAITITRGLGFRYLWIDRLCIIQDDTAVVKAECDRMCDIYEAATLTLAALGDGDGTKGLLLPRKVVDYPPTDSSTAVMLPCVVAGEVLGEVGVTPLLNEPDVLKHQHASNLHQEFCTSRWITRGWVFQERVLSRRVVYFGQREMYWECNKANYSEDGTLKPHDAEPEGHRYEEKELLYLNLVGDKFMSMFAGNLGAPVHQTWSPYVAHFSTLALTFPGDRLRAIDGVAQALKKRRGGLKYAMGLWLDTLPAQLMWYTLAAVQPQKEWRAPSWTWASTDNVVRFPELDAVHSVTLKYRACTKTISFQPDEPGPLEVETRLLTSVSAPPHRVVVGDGSPLPPACASFEDELEDAIGGDIEHGFMHLLNSSRAPEIGGCVFYLEVAGVVCGQVRYDSGVAPTEDEDGRFEFLVLSVLKKPEGVKAHYYHILAVEKVAGDMIEPSGEKNVYRRLGIGNLVWYKCEEEDVEFGIDVLRDEHSKGAKVVLV